MATATKKSAVAGDKAAQQELIEEFKNALGDEVHDKLVRGGEEGLTPQTLERWLVARKWDLAIATKDLKAHADWRVAYVPDGMISEASISAELEHDKAFLQGCDNAGHPLCLVIVKRHMPQNLEMCKRFIVYCLDAACRMGGQSPEWDGKAVGIFDLNGMGFANSDVGALRAVFDLLQFHYPERLAKLYLYCAPLIFYGVWKLVAPFVDPVTKAKVQFVFKAEATKTIFAQNFAKSVLPPEFGGTGDFCKVQDAVEAMRQAGVIKPSKSCAVVESASDPALPRTGESEEDDTEGLGI